MGFGVYEMEDIFGGKRSIKTDEYVAKLVYSIGCIDYSAISCILECLMALYLVYNAFFFLFVRNLFLST